MGGPGDWTHMLAGPICFNKLDWRDWKGPLELNDTRAQQGKNLWGPQALILSPPPFPAPYAASLFFSYATVAEIVALVRMIMLSR